MMRTKKSCAEKLRPDMEPKVVDDPKGRGKMLIPTPLLVAEAVKGVPKGRLITPARIRDQLARRFRADITCPLTTGIFLNIVAGAAEEDLASGKPRPTPYWRVVRENGALVEKFPPGVRRQAELLKREGHALASARKGAAPRVEGFERFLV